MLADLERSIESLDEVLREREPLATCADCAPPQASDATGAEC